MNKNLGQSLLLLQICRKYYLYVVLWINPCLRLEPQAFDLRYLYHNHYTK